MTVKELIARLKQFEPDQEVHIGYDYGDHCHTSVAPKVRRIEEHEVRWSAYHQMDAVIDYDEEDDDERESREVVVLS